MKPNEFVEVLRDLEFFKREITDPKQKDALIMWRIRSIPRSMIPADLMALVYERYGNPYPNYPEARTPEGVKELAQASTEAEATSEGAATGKQEQAQSSDSGANHSAGSKRGRKAKA